ncbi:hypothetical protein HOD75_04970 [archaeon]|jgi:hypothetical protein|nr:hypothetical protein [archaeon]MBT4242217.1 hypothetical protein [archaeon]MBT4417905.1 hypothetical protein [archaeon]
MKRGHLSPKVNINLFLVLFLFTILFIPFISAIDITLSKENYQPRETLQAEIIGNFVSLTADNILLYEQGVPRSTPAISDLTYQDNTYYFYAILPNKQANFSLKIENAEYYDQENIISDTITKDFEIKTTNQSSLQINPGFIVSEESFSINVKSLNENQDVKLDFENITQTHTIIQEDEKTIELTSIKKQSSTLKIDDYNIPIFITSEPITPPIPQSRDLKFTPTELTAKVISNQDYFFRVILENIGNKNLTNLQFSSDIATIIEPSVIPLINSKTKEFINLTVKVPETQDNFTGEITLTYLDNTQQLKLPILFEIIETQEEINLTPTETPVGLNCDEFGIICDSDEICDGSITKSLQGNCCIGNCIVEPEPSNYGMIFLGILILLVVAFFGFIIYRRFKKKKIKTPEQLLKEKSEKYSKRIQPQQPPAEVRGKLDRI